MVEIKEVKTKKQQKEFIEFPLKLYKNNPCFIPPLYGDEKKLFSSKNIYNDQCETVYYNAYKDGKIAGRISGILQKASNEKWGQKRVRFTRFDSINDKEVSNALFDAIEKWAKNFGMEELVGPLGFSDLEREGLLIDGFDEVSTFEEQYNAPYYQELVENFGFTKEVDWVERYLEKPDVYPEKLERISMMMMKKYELHFGEAKNTADFIKKYGDQFFEILDTTYARIYGTVPFTKAMKDMMIANFKLIVDLKYVAVILDKNNKVVAFGICFPAIGEALQKSGGKLTLPAIIKVLKALKHPKVIELGLIGVLPEYEMKGIASALIVQIFKMFDQGIEHIETNLTLEENYHIQNQYKSFKYRIHKRRRCFVKSI